MKSTRLLLLILAALAAPALQQALAQPLDLSLYTTGSTGVYTNTFDSLGYSTNQTVDGTPGGTPGSLGAEWTCYIGATHNYFGTVAAGAPNVSSPGSMNNWTNPFNGGFFNYASYYSYNTTNNPYIVAGTNLYYTNGWPGYSIANGTVTNGVITDPFFQTNEPNRCLGIRQVGTTYDPGSAFVLKLANTLLYHGFKMSVDLINLDPTSPRETTWLIQYGITDPTYGVPTAWQNAVSLNSVWANTPGTVHWKSLRNVSIPDGEINNYNGQVWLRIATLDTSTGSGNRQTFAIDNFGLTWQVGNPGCVLVTNKPTIAPTSLNAYVNSTVEFTVNEPGNQPIYYQWLWNGTPVVQAFPGQVLYNSDASSILTLANVTTANQGTYSCLVSNVCGGTSYMTNSPGAVLTVSPIPSVNLGYLRTLTDPTVGYTPTVPGSDLWQVTGMITTLTNTTSGNTASYYIQDATGGMNLFVTWGSAYRPNIGDVVTAVGYLNSYQNNLELEVDLSNSANSLTTLSNNIANYPVPLVLDWANEFAVGVTNNTVEQGTTNTTGVTTNTLGMILTGLGSKKGSICLLTNVYFGTNAGVLITGNYYAYVTNSAGLGGYVYFWGAYNNDVISNTIPAFAYSVQGPLFANESGNAGSFWSGIGVSRWSDVNTTTPPLTPVTSLTTVRSGSNLNINYAGGSASHFVLLGTNNIKAPTATWPVVAITNGTTPGTFTIPIGSGGSMFYRVQSQ